MSQESIPIPSRIRNRRKQRRMPGYRLAELVGISPSYLSLIETGRKVPSAEIAEKLARALGDPPDLYRAWARADRDPYYESSVEEVRRLRRALADPSARHQLAIGSPLAESADTLSEQDLEDTDELQTFGMTGGEHPADEAPLERAAARRARHLGDRVRDLIPRAGARGPAGRVLDVPLLADGADPDREPERVREVLQLDSRLLPPGVREPFAYRPSDATRTRVATAIAPDELVVLARHPARLESSAIYAVRHQGRVILSRILYHDGTLLLLPPAGGGDAISIPCAGETDARSVVVGVVVASLRRWPSGDTATTLDGPMARAVGVTEHAPVSGRSVRREGSSLVRDCEWRESYGWRPVQRPEDMDWLDAHPGSTIRFNLIRDGEVKYVLEMNAEQWREALGSYLHAGRWRENGYVVAITHRRDGEYTEEFQPRWAGLVSEVSD